MSRRQHDGIWNFVNRIFLRRHLAYLPSTRVTESKRQTADTVSQQHNQRLPVQREAMPLSQRISFDACDGVLTHEVSDCCVVMATEVPHS